MIYISDIEKIINNTLNENNLDIVYEFDINLSAPMSYNVSTNTIKFNYLQVNGYKGKIRIKVTEEDFVKIILYRMLGYYLDFKKNKHDLRILMYGHEEEKEKLKSEIETNAWEYGRTLIPEQLLESYDKIRELDKMLIN
ncbi:hypothetical protein QUF81_18540 [Peribacillus simplex]|uniref:Immunity protein 63 domain-containing protein n=1 Tax=Peribacillus simplex TaxID=1478 RepID=A0AAW7ID84_9BACI|nr:hypothetical protein [Peribacillus simplex]AMM92749.1 hypothetical protein UP17_09605 [Peribacillus simplex]MDM5295128.1 hypothetical protein [Peribacillus simplex]MDM5454090.1 hypothetical protein [Peribacillus simplex]